MPKKIMALLTLLLMIPLIAYGLFVMSKSRTFQFFGTLVSRVDTNDKIIALTFDDAPSAFSNQVVDILAEKSIPATFFVIGQNIKQFPQETKYIVEHHNQLGNHSYSHQRFLFKSWSFIDQEIQTTNQLIKEAGYTDEIVFRPPNGKKLFLLPLYLQQHQMKTIMWDVEPDTYVAGDSEAIVQYTLEHTQPGSIILLHPFCETTCQADRKALPQIIDQLHQKGYRFVTINELLQLK